FLGTVLYWMMGRFQTKRPSLLSKARINRDEPLIVTEDSQGGLEYSDCILKDNDARFVFHFIRRALRSGAIALNYGEALAATYQSKGLWQIKAEDRVSQQAISIQAKVLINAGGPYADQINVQSGVKSKHRHIFSKGVHLIVPRIGSSSRVLTFFADDGRLFFVIPMGSCSCIGTTDTRVKDLPAKVTNEDRHFILANINKRLRLAKPLTMDDVIAERCGVRPLVVEVQAENFDQEEWINLSRKHVLEIDQEQAHISIFGGKLTDCLNIGRELLEACVRLKLPAKLDKLWFGEGQAAIKTEFLRDAEGKPWNQKVWPGEARQSERLWRIYGDEAVLIAEHMHKDPSLQEPVQPEAPVLMAEVLYMAEYEMIVNLEDFLRRRTRLSLLVRAKDLEKSPGLRKACHILFAENAEKQWQTYFAKT
ncbi:MAG: FAD-dependent oxidoreductase, partial [Proteobacteria bacterium]|nr:FAD-dependent oxidoreductase [Pseudomonadota bacterium]